MALAAAAANALVSEAGGTHAQSAIATALHRTLGVEAFRTFAPKKGTMNTIAAPRGTADLLPSESPRWQAVEGRIREIAHRFGYGEIRTPIFESTDLFVRGVGDTTDIVEKEMYTFTDKGDRSLTLRPEMTAGCVRASLEHHLFAQGAQRMYYIGPIFRYERPQAGRFRQAHQFGVECFGYEQPEADVEVIQIAYELLREFGIDDAVLRLNSIGDANCRDAYREALLAHFRPHLTALSADSQRRLERNPLRILDSKAPEDLDLVASAPTSIDVLCEPCRAHFARVRALLEEIGVPYVVDPKIVRGLDYYTRTVFEFISPSLGAQSTICGGGRYDGLVQSLGGPAVPAVGFALGLERFTMILAQRDGERSAERSGMQAIALGDAARARLFPLVAELRRSGDVTVAMDFAAAKLATSLKRADRNAARVALIVGDDELARGEIVVRDLASRAQSTIAISESDSETARSVRAWYDNLPPPAPFQEAS
jgi:histidyl-tRNA synthetase